MELVVKEILQPQILMTMVISLFALLYSFSAMCRARQERRQVKKLALTMRQWEEESYTPDQIAWLDRHAGRPNVIDDKVRR